MTAECSRVIGQDGAGLAGRICCTRTCRGIIPVYRFRLSERAAGGCFSARLVDGLVLGYTDPGVVPLSFRPILDTILDTADYNVAEIAGWYSSSFGPLPW